MTTTKKKATTKKTTSKKTTIKKTAVTSPIEIITPDIVGTGAGKIWNRENIDRKRITDLDQTFQPIALSWIRMAGT